MGNFSPSAGGRGQSLAHRRLKQRSGSAVKPEGWVGTKKVEPQRSDTRSTTKGRFCGLRQTRAAPLGLDFNATLTHPSGSAFSSASRVG